MWTVKLIYGIRFTAKNMAENKNLVVFSGTDYTESGFVYVHKSQIEKMERITR